MFCGVLWCFAGVLWCFAGVLCFVSVLQYFHKTHKTPEKHRKTLKNTKNSQYARVMRAFSKSKIFDCIAQNTFHKTSAKHRKTPQNTAKRSQNAFCEITSQNTAKRTQNAKRSKSHKTVALQPQYVLRAFGVFFKNTSDLSQKYTMHNTRVNYGLRGVSRTPAGDHVFSKKQCFAVFCGVLRYFVCVFLAFFTKQHKTDQKTYKTHKTNKIRCVQYSAIRCCASFSH